MNALTLTIGISQVIATLAVVSTFLIQQRQFRLQFRQTQGQNALDLVRYLEEPDHLAARAAMTKLATKGYHNWNDQDRSNADIVARIWTTAAVFQEDRTLLPPQFLDLYYGGSIVRHWKVCEPYVLDLRKKTGASQRSHFEALAKRVEANGWFNDLTKDARPIKRR